MPLNENGRKCKVQKCKSTGKPCTNNAVNGYEVCGVHGGRTPKGMASANYKGKGYSNHLPTRLIENYEMSLADPELLANRKSVALLDARLIELIGSIGKSPIGDLWGEVNRVVMEIESSLHNGNAEAALAFLSELGRITKAGFKDFATWKEIRQMLQERSKLVSAENKRLNDQQLTLTVDRVMLLVSAIAGVVMENVTDNRTRDKITRGIDVLISSGV